MNTMTENLESKVEHTESFIRKTYRKASEYINFKIGLSLGTFLGAYVFFHNYEGDNLKNAALAGGGRFCQTLLVGGFLTRVIEKVAKKCNTIPAAIFAGLGVQFVYNLAEMSYYQFVAHAQHPISSTYPGIMIGTPLTIAIAYAARKKV